MRISDWSSDVCSSDLPNLAVQIVVESGTPDDVGIGINQFTNVIGGLIDFHQAHILATCDGDNDPLGALHTDAIKQRVCNGPFSGFKLTAVTFGFAGAYHRLAHFPPGPTASAGRASGRERGERNVLI